MSVVLKKINPTKDSFADIWGKIESNNEALLGYMDTYGIDVKEEYYTATKGQTDFTLTKGVFITGTGSLSVFVDNVPQFLGKGFVETSSNSFRVSEGLEEGQRVCARYYVR